MAAAAMSLWRQGRCCARCVRGPFLALFSWSEPDGTPRDICDECNRKACKAQPPGRGVKTFPEPDRGGVSAFDAASDSARR